MNASSESGLCATVILWTIQTVYQTVHAVRTVDAERAAGGARARRDRQAMRSDRAKRVLIGDVVADINRERRTVEPLDALANPLQR